MRKPSCAHCDPYVSSPHHTLERFEGFIFPATHILISVGNLIKKKFPSAFTRLSRGVLTGIFTLLLASKIFQEVDASEETTSNSRALVIVKEARKRGLPIKSIRIFGKRETNYFSITINGETIFFEGLPTAEIFDAPLANLDDKHVFKNLLREHGLPHAAGECFSESSPGLLFGSRNFPVVVKPKSGSLSKHTTCNVRTEDELREAIRIAQLIEKEYIVEEFVEGNIYRVTVVDGTIIASCLREPPNVSGDGKHTIEELVELKNNDQRRGYAHQKNFTLHKIQLDSEKAQAFLLQQGVNKGTILPLGKKIHLHNKVTLSAGADIHDTTDLIHPDNSILFKNVYAICGMPVVGIDFIIADISRSYRSERSVILEVNSLPYIDMHHYPVTGTPRNVAGSILDYCISRKRS
ncbi:MAG: hypothetical protein A2408_01470 [Candidatus Yonathbacteria bacterium RIFOXYC1_FULL_52_10]|uniref:ATP-grasp domain-containing protein n=1 Tax=Candidatus Yonathbacteria bacterium RIFOXYD1_FULL_52_36 TaxID=1802730 RepID=A0A1G2SMT3_9BACT|nr:MAG: hypothetical protein A2408_01470 [Candidatus Yonathbacteria bacterium RIFOXYC1_FULL_52_10]OHA86008.1 MAG: hypothetical protein A2591_02405 [Candidatus Yonathbacteria bacterium RIFOXYD1_FULL_52_36]